MKQNSLIKRVFIAIAMMLTCVTYTKAQEIQPLWTIPADTYTGSCSSRTGNGFGDTFFGSNYQAGTIDEWKDGQLVASYDINGFCAANEIGETIKVKDEAIGEETEKFATYVLWTSVMVDDGGNVLVNVGTSIAASNTCQNWILLPASNRNDMQFLHIDEFPGNVAKGRVDVSCNIVGDISTGASNDIERASDIARKMVTRYGMSEELGPIMYGSGDHEVFLGRDYNNSRNYSESVAYDIDKEVKKLISGCYDRCNDIINSNMDKLETVAEYLIKHEKLDGKTFEKLMKGESTEESEVEQVQPTEAHSEQETETE